jgi:hypothetical protein
MMNPELMMSLARDRHNDLIAEAAKRRLVGASRRARRARRVANGSGSGA